MAVRWTGGWSPKAGCPARRSRWKHGPGLTPPSSPHTRPGQAVSPCGEMLVMGTVHGAEKSSRHPAHSGVRSVPPNTLMFVQPRTCPWQGPCRPGGDALQGQQLTGPWLPPNSAGFKMTFLLGGLLCTCHWAHRVHQPPTGGPAWAGVAARPPGASLHFPGSQEVAASTWGLNLPNPGV